MKREYTKFHKTLEESVEKLQKTAMKGRWLMSYDKDADVFYITSPKLSEKFILLPLNEKNLSIRVNCKGKVEGFVIDNFWSFFAVENKDFYDFAKLVIEGKVKQHTELKLRNQSNKIKALIYEFCKSFMLTDQMAMAKFC